MKISNSKKQLAKIIHENGGWRDGAYWSVQNGDHGRISFSTNKPVRHGQKSWMAKGGFQFKIEVCKPLPNWHQTLLSRDEYFHLYPAPDADGWIEWSGGECPVDVGTIVDVKHRDGDIGIRCHAGLSSSEPDGEGTATAEDWHHLNEAGDIIAYRLHKPEQAKPEFCGLVLSVAPVKKYTGKFYNSELGESPAYSQKTRDAVCDGCGKRYGEHYGDRCKSGGEG